MAFAVTYTQPLPHLRNLAPRLREISRLPCHVSLHPRPVAWLDTGGSVWLSMDLEEVVTEGIRRLAARHPQARVAQAFLRVRGDGDAPELVVLVVG